MNDPRLHFKKPLLTSPFHARTSAFNKLNSWGPWGGYTTVLAYDDEPMEYTSIRNQAGVYDLSPMVKYKITGKDAATGMGACACEPESGNYSFILGRTYEGPQEKHLFGGEFAVVPVAADKAVLFFQVFGGEKFIFHNELADAGGIGLKSCHDPFHERGAGFGVQCEGRILHNG